MIMEEKKKKLIDEKEKIEEKIKNLQNKLKMINQDLENIELNIELEKKSKSTGEIMELLKGKGVENIDNFIELLRAGKVNINSENK